MKKFIFLLFLFFNINLYSLNIGMPNPYIHDKIIHIGIMETGVSYRINRFGFSVSVNPLPFFLSSFGIKDFFSITGNINFSFNKKNVVYMGFHSVSYKGEDFLKETLNKELEDIIIIKELELNFNALEIYGGFLKKLSFMDLWGNFSYSSFSPEHSSKESSIKLGVGVKKDIQLLAFYKLIPYLTVSYDTLMKSFISSLTIDNKFWNTFGVKLGLIYPGIQLSVGKIIDVPVLPVFDIYIELIKF